MANHTTILNAMRSHYVKISHNVVDLVHDLKVKRDWSLINFRIV